MTSETNIQTAICKELRKRGFFFWRNNNGAVWDHTLNSGYGAYRAAGEFSLKGVPDIIMILPSGVFAGIEVKTKTGKQSPDQVLFADRCRRYGAYYLVARSVEDVTLWITEVLHL